MKKNIIIIGFALLLFIQLASAPWNTNNMLEKFGHDLSEKTKTAADSTIGWVWEQGNCEDPWLNQPNGLGILNLLGPSLMVILIVIMFNTLFYLFAVLFQLPNFIAIAKDEYWQTAWTLVRLWFIFLCIIATNALWFPGAIDPNSSENQGIYDGSQRLDPLTRSYVPSSYHIDLAIAFSKNMVYKISENIGFLLLYNTIIHTIYSATMWVGVTWRSMWSFNLGPVLKPLIDLVGIVLQFLFVAVGEWILHIVTLCIIKKWSFSLFIPVAIFIRSFPVTRGAGDALLALFFALTLFYPVMFIVDAEVYRVTQAYLVDGSSVLSSFFTGGIFGSVGLIAVVMMLLGGVMVPFMLNSAIPIAFALVKNAVYFIVIMGFVLPFLNIFVTLTAAREIAKAFGVDVNFMAFVRVI